MGAAEAGGNVSGGAAPSEGLGSIVELLGRCPLFATTPEAIRAKIAERMTRHELGTGDVLTRRDGPPALYVVVSGKVAAAVRNTRSGSMQIVSTLQTPDSFGGFTLVLGESVALEYTALSRTAMYRLSKEVFEAIMRQVSEFATAVSRNVAAEASLFARYGAIPWADLDALSFDERLWSCLPAALAASGRVCPIDFDGQVMTVAMSDPRDVGSLDTLSSAVPGVGFRVIACTSDDLQRFIGARGGLRRETKASSAPPPADARTSFRFLSDDPGQQPRDGRSKTSSTPPPAVGAIEEIIGAGLSLGASDIHIEPERQGVYVRYRIDGALRRPRDPFPTELARAIVIRLKTLARLDITETRKPQDGRISVQLASGKLVDLRLSTVPAKFGEKIAMRVLDSEGAITDLKALFVVEQVRNLFARLLARRTGFLLVTGPTGSGKSTTLYSALNAARAQHVNIMTVEDPIEYHLDGVTQVEVHPEAGTTFATVLRALLRQDPNIILVGEMRDAETARIAVEASLTGHLVLSSLHTNGTLEAVARMRDMGIEPYALANGLLAVVHQRLVQRTCPHCVAPFDYPPMVVDALARHGLIPDGHSVTLVRGAGCARCRNTGLLGRTAVCGMLVVNDEMREAIGRRASLGELRTIAAQGAHIEMSRYAGALLRMGVTVPGEVLPLLQRVED